MAGFARLSQVQELGLEILQLVDMRERAKTFWNTIRTSLLAGEKDPDRIRRVFPEIFETEQEEITDKTDIDKIDPSSIAWKAPSRGGYEDWLRLQHELESNGRGRLSVGRRPDSEGTWQ